MRVDVALLIAKKEILETLRDRKTLFRIFVLPIVMYPTLLMGIAAFESRHAAEQEARTSKVALVGEAPNAVREELEKDRAAIAPAVIGGDVAASAKAACAKRDVDAVIALSSGFEEKIRAGEAGSAEIYYDSARDDSRTAKERAEKALDAYRERVLGERLRARGLPQGFMKAVDVADRDVAEPSRRMGKILGGVIPFLLISMSMLGALPAIDLTAGEKERNTMQTLLCAPISSREIVGGKFLAVWAMTLVMTLANLGSFGFSMSRMLSTIPGLSATALSVYALVFALMLPVSFLVSALFLALATLAKDYKEGQAQTMALFFPIYLLGGAAVLPGVELSTTTALVPIMNVSLLAKSVFLGEAAPALVAVVLASSAVYATLALLLAAWVFEREDVLLGSISLKKLFRRS